MELVKELVKKAIPSLSSDKMDALMARLVELGVQCEDDMILVEAPDIQDTLPLIQCRRLVKAFQGDSQAAPQFRSPGPTSTPLPQSDDLPPTPPETLPAHTPSAHSPSCEPYSIPWHKMPSKLMDVLGEKKWVKSKERLQMVRIVVDDYLHKHPGRPGRSKLMEIAKNILENRVENIKRTSTPGKRRAEGGEGEVQRKKKSRNSDRYGCVEWDVAVEGTESRAELLSKRNELKSAFKTHDPQRETINDGTNVKVLKEEWPFLFEAAHLFDHASTLLGFSVQNKLAQALSKKEPGINNFLDTKGMKMGEGPEQLICGIVRYFKENPDHLFCKNEDSADAELSLPCTPCILIRGDHLFEIAVDQEVVNDHITSPIVALSYAFCLFYVCNIEYPKEMSLTLEFMQRVFFGINPDRGSKAEMKGKKQHHIPPKLSKLVTELKEFDWHM
ncbi:Cyanogenic beta-glucosidase [Dissostichus eleginoides]|uniref:Cyanogenic beta-glucosidase n=1 Tax=Dissostichus eleginoides TaxID=100907 RepID=A0AAD9EXL7_DISEL|nr:Cyanogenic beta-glucosidase [Dissostichus eleginoides]